MTNGTIVGPKQIICWECAYCGTRFDDQRECGFHIADHFKSKGETV